VPFTPNAAARSWYRSSRRVILLVFLACLAALVQSAVLAHVHEARTTGFYDEQHVYVSLETVSGIDAPLIGTAISAWLVVVFSGASRARRIPLPLRPAHHRTTRAPPAR
jgi:hypothetical protein